MIQLRKRICSQCGVEWYCYGDDVKYECKHAYNNNICTFDYCRCLKCILSGNENNLMIKNDKYYFPIVEMNYKNCFPDRSVKFLIASML